MLFRSSLDLLCKQMLLPKPFIVLGSQSNLWYSQSSLHPPAPKRNKSAYIFYVMDQYSRVNKENPKWSNAEIFSKLANSWRNLDKSTADKYHQQALHDKKKYEEELASFRATLTPDAKIAAVQSREDKKKKAHKKKLRALGMPKRPPNAYILFFTDYLAKNLKGSKDAFTEAQRISDLWKNLPSDEKATWNDLAALKCNEYKIKLREWESEMTEKGHLEVIQPKK